MVGRDVENRGNMKPLTKVFSQKGFINDYENFSQGINGWAKVHLMSLPELFQYLPGEFCRSLHWKIIRGI